MLEPVTIRWARRVAAGVVLAGLAAACGDRRSPPRAAARGPSSGSIGEAAGEVGLDSAAAAQPAVKWLDDANVLALVSLVNAQQTRAADVELESWHSDTVRAFAASIAREHAALQHSVDSLAASLRLALVTPALAQQLGDTMQAQIDSLYGLGPSLDRAFVRQQIASHELIAPYIAGLAGVAERPEVKGLLTNAAQQMAADLANAKTLDALFAVADSARADSGSTRGGRKGRG